MNIRDSIDVHTVLRYALNLPGSGGTVPDGEDARQAAARLADRAHKATMAGPRSGDVLAAWPESDGG